MVDVMSSHRAATAAAVAANWIKAQGMRMTFRHTSEAGGGAN